MCETAKEVALRKGQLTKSLKKVREQAMGTSCGGGAVGGDSPGRWISELEDAKGEKGRSVGHEIHTIQDL